MKITLRHSSVVAVVLSVLAVVGSAASRIAPQALFGISPEEYAERRAKVRQAAGGAIVLLRAPREESDLTRFRTDNDLLYLTGIETPGAYLALLPDGDPSGKQAIVFLPPARRGGGSQWVNTTPSADAATEASTGLDVASYREVWSVLTPSLQKAARVCLVGPVGDRAKYHVNGDTEERIRAVNPAIAVTSEAGGFIHGLRWTKSPAEVANLRSAIAATGLGIRNLARAIRPGATELACEGALIAGFRAGGAVREGFPCIVASGPNSLILHHNSSDKAMVADETVVSDVGAEFNYYSADITRTMPVGGRFSPRQRELYKLVLEVQSACAKSVVPGKSTLWDLQKVAVSTFRESPLRAKGADGAESTLDRFFVHSVSHSLGMDVHDVMGRNSVLAPGVVFTIEPGLYIASEGIGIRIEDDFLVTADGAENLSASIPSDPGRVEAMMRGR